MATYKSPGAVGGVNVPQQTTTTPPAALPGASPAVPPPAMPASVGGSSPGSAINLGGTKKALLKDATAANKDVEAFAVAPLTAANIQLAQNLAQGAQADWYRNGKPGTQEGRLFDLMPRRLVPFDDEQASIRVFGLQKGKDVELLPAYTKFILESAQESRTERTQVVETFGNFYVFLFGERPSVVNFSGTLINSKNANWVSDFEFYYDNFLRGTKLVEMNARILMTYGGRMIEGFMTGMGKAMDAALETGVKVNFQIIVTGRRYLGFSDDFGLMSSDGKTFQADQKLKDLVAKVAGPSGKGLSSQKANTAAKATTTAMSGKGAAGVL